MIATATALIQATEESIFDDDTAVDKATKVLLTESQLAELTASIDEMDSLRNEVLNG